MLANKDGAARLRRLWLNVHLWSGLSVGVLLVALGLSGSLLVWRDSLDRLGNPARYAVTAGNPALPASAYLANAAAALGGGFAPQTLRYPEGDGSPVVVQARNAGNPDYTPYPKGAHRHLGLIAEAVLAERAARIAAVASAMAPPGTGPESAIVTSIIERMRAGESAVAIARETGAVREPGPGGTEGGTPGA